jgi:allophanate hydrolase
MDLSITNLRQRYLKGEITPTAVVEHIAKVTKKDPNRIWIHRLPVGRLREYAKALEGKDIAALPLYGVPFAIKDNIDLAGVPTTAACPAFAYTPKQSALVVQRLIDAGAIPVGKTNLD